MKAGVLVDQRVVLSNRYSALVKVYEVSTSKKYPDGIKAKFLLLDNDLGKARLLVDNHAPIGFHVHSDLPKNYELRVPLEIHDYRAALKYFWKEVERILQNEKD